MAVYKEVDGVVVLVQEDLTQGIIEASLGEAGLEVSPCSKMALKDFVSGKTDKTKEL